MSLYIHIKVNFTKCLEQGGCDGFKKGSQNIWHTNRCLKEEFFRMHQNATQELLSMRKGLINL